MRSAEFGMRSGKRQIGILGGTFNPVHYGHLAAGEEVRDRLKLDKVLFIPSFLPPHKEDGDIPSALQRMEMVRLAVAGNPHFTVSDIEVTRKGRSFTVDTLETLLSNDPDSEFFFITGLDSFLEIQTWHRWERLMTLASFVVLSRPGYRFSDLGEIDFMVKSAMDLAALDVSARDRSIVTQKGFRIYLEQIPHYDISSTDIRNRVRNGRTIKYHLPESVEHYIINHKLYA